MALEELKNRKVWVNFTASKIPINPVTLHNGSSTNSRTWADYQAAAANIGKSITVKVGRGDKAEQRTEVIKGVGIILGEASGLSAVDLDDVIDDQGYIDETALQIIRSMDSYTEISPSGHGIHIFFRGKCPVEGCKVNVDGKSRELYAQGRYMTVTGRIFDRYATVQERTKQAAEVYETYYKPYIRQQSANRRKASGKGRARANGNDAVEAIRRHDYKYFRDVLKEKKSIFDNQELFFDFIYRYPLDKFLGIPAGTAFCCFFHPDSNPSASIYQSGAETGKKWLYHCHSENMTLTIKTFVEKVGDFESEVDSLDFIKQALNVEIKETKWSRKQHKTIDLILDRLVRTDSESFSILCPTADKNLKFGKDLYLQILIIAKSTIYPSKYSNSGDVLFYMSLDQISKAAQRSSKDKVCRWIKTLQYHGLLTAVPDAEIPQHLLQKARRQSNNQYRHISFYKIPSLVIKKLEYVERQGRKWKEFRYTVKGCSYEMFLRAEGREIADRLYPQRLADNVGSIATVGATANAKAEARHDRVHEAVIYLLQEQGYFTEKQVLELYGGKTWGTIQIKRSMGELMETYGLVRKKAGKALKQRFSIDCEGYPYIYFQG